MEKGKKTLLLTLALVFIGMLLIASVFASKEYTDSIYHASPSVIQTYKSYSSEDTTPYKTTPLIAKPIQVRPIQTRPVQVYYLDKNEHKTCRSYGYGCYYNYYEYNERDDYYYGDNEREVDTTIHYTQYGIEKTRDNLFGDYVKEYSTYVTNRGETGRYFTVNFNFENKRGQEFSQSMTKYLKAGEKKNFVYKDIQYERNEIIDWDYDILPERY